MCVRPKHINDRYVRQYFSEQKGGRDSLWPWTHHPGFTKSWEAMFNTTDVSRAVALAEAEGFKAEWAHGDARVLKLSHDMPATRKHPVTGRTIWSNHLAVIQVLTARRKQQQRATTSVFFARV